MIEIHFTLDGIQKKETAVFYSLKDMQGFLKTFKEEVLTNCPTATDIRLGKCFAGI